MKKNNEVVFPFLIGKVLTFGFALADSMFAGDCFHSL